MKLKFIGIIKIHDPSLGIKEFKMGPSERKRFKDYCRTLSEGSYQITIEPLKKERSGKQNKYFHGVLLDHVREAIGYRTIDEAKDEVREQFLKIQFEEIYPDGYNPKNDIDNNVEPELILIQNKYYGPLEPDILESAKMVHRNGRKVYYPTHKLTTKGQELLNEDIRAWIAFEFGINIPEPNQYEDY